jgi:hypothetical protein
MKITLVPIPNHTQKHYSKVRNMCCMWIHRLVTELLTDTPDIQHGQQHSTLVAAGSDAYLKCSSKFNTKMISVQ